MTKESLQTVLGLPVNTIDNGSFYNIPAPITPKESVKSLPIPAPVPKHRGRKAKVQPKSSKILESPKFQMTPAQILDCKVEILRILSDGLAKNIATAARMIHVQPARVYQWALHDTDFDQMLQACYEVVADDIEAGFLAGKNDIPKMMLLKGIRPKYRDGYREPQSSEKIESFLEQLKKLADSSKE